MEGQDKSIGARFRFQWAAKKIPWPGLLASLVVSIAMMIVTIGISERRDF